VELTQGVALGWYAARLWRFKAAATLMAEPMSMTAADFFSLYAAE